MSQTIEAIYENGMFRPLSEVDLPENSRIEIEVHISGEEKLTDEEHLQKTLSPAERAKFFREWADQARDVPELSDDALRRENMYEDRY